MQTKRKVQERRGQSTVEYAILLAIIISALLAVQVFVKRAQMGRMRSVTDDQFGRQWDPFNVTGSMTEKNQSFRQEVRSTGGTSTTTLAAAEESSRTATAETVGAVNTTPGAGGTDLFGP